MVNPRVCLLVSLLACAVALAAPPTRFSVVARSGDAAPGISGAAFRAFGYPVLNNRGEVLFKAALEWGGGVNTANDDGVWAGKPGDLRLVAREADPVPGLAAGVAYASFSSVRLDDAGGVVLGAALQGTAVSTANDTCTLAGTPGALAIVAREGDTAPGVGAGEVFGDLGMLESLQLAVGRPGEVAFRGRLAGTAPPAGDTAVWVGRAGALRLIAREGAQAPGLPAGIVFDDLTFEEVRMNPAGRCAFAAGVRGPGLPLPQDGIWVGDTNGVTRAIHAGQAVPDWAGATFHFFDRPTIGEQGGLSFVGAVSTGGLWLVSAVFAGPPDALRVAAREGDTAPGMPAGVVFASLALEKPVLGRGGHVAFKATVAGPGIDSANNTALWAGRPGCLAMFCRRGDPAAAMPPGVRYSTAFAATFDLAGLNACGRITHVSLLEGAGIAVTNNRAVWAGVPGYQNLLFQTGAKLDLGDGVPRTIHTIDLADVKGELLVSGGQDGRPRSLNDADLYLVHVTFTGAGGQALLMVGDVCDHDGNGLPTVLEAAYGMGEAENADDVRPVFNFDRDVLRVLFREKVSEGAPRIVFEQAGGAGPGGGWGPLDGTATNATDQSGLPPGVVRRIFSAPLAGDRAGFYRIGAWTR